MNILEKIINSDQNISKDYTKSYLLIYWFK